MKEITSIMTVTITTITKVKDDKFDEYMEKSDIEKKQRDFSDALKKILSADHVLLSVILFERSHVKLNLGITGGIQYQWQGLRRHECPIDIEFACD